MAVGNGGEGSRPATVAEVYQTTVGHGDTGGGDQALPEPGRRVIVQNQHSGRLLNGGGHDGGRIRVAQLPLRIGSLGRVGKFAG